MSDKLRELTKQAIAGSISKQEARVLGGALFRYGWRLAVFVFVLWSFGGFAKWGFGGGFALADTQKAITDDRIQAAVSPLNDRLEAIEKAVAKTADETKTLSRIVISDKAKNLEEKLIDTTIRWCKADTQSSKDYWFERLRDYRREYRELTQAAPDFEVPSCADLVRSQ